MDELSLEEKIIQAGDKSDVLDVLVELDPKNVRDRCISICKSKGERLDKSNTHVFRGEDFIIDYFSEDEEKLVVSEKRAGGYKVVFHWENGSIIKFNGVEVWNLILNSELNIENGSN